MGEGGLDGWRREKGLASFLLFPHTLVEAVGSGFQFLWALLEPSSSHLLGGTSTSWTVPPPKRSEPRLPDPVGSFL